MAGLVANANLVYEKDQPLLGLRLALEAAELVERSDEGFMAKIDARLLSADSWFRTIFSGDDQSSQPEDINSKIEESIAAMVNQGRIAALGQDIIAITRFPGKPSRALLTASSIMSGTSIIRTDRLIDLVDGTVVDLPGAPATGNVKMHHIAEDSPFFVVEYLDRPGATELRHKDILTVVDLVEPAGFRYH